MADSLIIFVLANQWVLGIFQRDIWLKRNCIDLILLCVRQKPVENAKRTRTNIIIKI